MAMTAAPIMTHRDAGREVVATIKQRLKPSGTAKNFDYKPYLPQENTNTAPVLPGVPRGYHLEDVAVAVRDEHARTLADVLYRRMGLAWTHQFSSHELTAIADVMAHELGWSVEQRDTEIKRFREENAKLFGLTHP